MEYLSQLLGDPTPELLEFVDNVGRFERGEPLTIAYGGSQAEDSKPAALQPNITQPTKQKQQTSKKEVLETRQKNQKQNNQKSRVPPPKKNPPPPTNNHNSDQQLSTKKQPPPAANPSNTQQHSTKTEDEDSRVVEKSRPPRGKAKVHCGCFGTKHKSLTNCLYCGRISCVEEGYNFCNFCGLMVEEIKDPVYVDLFFCILLICARLHTPGQTHDAFDFALLLVA